MTKIIKHIKIQTQLQLPMHHQQISRLISFLIMERVLCLSMILKKKLV